MRRPLFLQDQCLKSTYILIVLKESYIEPWLLLCSPIRFTSNRSSSILKSTIDPSIYSDQSKRAEVWKNWCIFKNRIIKPALFSCVIFCRSVDRSHGLHHSFCSRRQDRSLCGASAIQKRRSQHGGQVRCQRVHRSLSTVGTRVDAGQLKTPRLDVNMG